MSENVENTPADGVNPQETTDQVLQTQEGAGEAANTNADNQLHGEPETETTGIETDAKRQGRAQPRIQQLIAERKQAQADAEYWRQRASSLQTNSAGNEVDHPDDASYRKAIVKEAVTDAQREAAEASHQEAIDRAIRARASAFAERVNDFREKATDFETVVYRLPRDGGPSITPLMADAIHEADNGPQIAYWLGKNTTESARIASLPPVRQAAEIGKLEQRLSAPAQKRTTTAPTPVKTVGSGTGSPAFDPETASMEDYRRHRMGKK